mgnify:CR=1 FL=1
MQTGDRLIAFSDGVVELENERNEMLGSEGVEDWLKAQPNINVEGILNNTLDYLGSMQRKDDVTLVIFTSQLLEQVKNKGVASKVPLKIVIDLDAKHIKSTDPIVDLVSVVTNRLSLYGIHSELFAVLSELYNNAIEHGVLELDSELKQSDSGFFAYFRLREQKLSTLKNAKIVITAEYLPDENALAIRIKDSGNGFKQQYNSSLEHVEKSYGRGIPLVKELCESVVYSNNGNTVDVVFKI